jgi:hypothetical protein
MGLVEILASRERRDFCARRALDKHLHGAVWQLQELQHVGERAHVIDAVGCRVVLSGVHLRRKHDLLFGAHYLFQRLDRLFTAHEERNDHVRENHDVAQREDREDAVAGSPGYLGHRITFLSQPPLADRESHINGREPSRLPRYHDMWIAARDYAEALPWLIG